LCCKRRFVISIRIKSNDKYHRILDAAAKVFADRGFHHSTVSMIAKEAGVADGTIYLYFKSKADILVQIFDYKARQGFERFRKEVDKADNAIEKLRNLVRIHLQEFQRDRDMALIYQSETHRKSRVVEQQIRDMSKLYTDIISEIVEQGQREGSLRRDLYLSLVKRFIIGSVDEVINTWLHSDGTYDLVSMADLLVELFIDGIGTSGEKKS